VSFGMTRVLRIVASTCELEETLRAVTVMHQPRNIDVILRIICVGQVKFVQRLVGHHKPTGLEFESESNYKSTRDNDPTEN
jgi:hypothetical protein